MMEEGNVSMADKGHRKRKPGKKKGSKGKKKLRMLQGSGERLKVNKKMKKLFRKRAREYNSDDDDDDDEEAAAVSRGENKDEVKMDGGDSSSEEVDDKQALESEDEGSEGEEDDVQPGIMKFTEGCRAFKLAFKNIIKKKLADDSLGPVLSGQRQLIAKKLAEEEADRKVKGEAKKEKRMVAEKGHLIPANYLDSHEKFLITVATKGVVKLFNAVSKAQHANKGLNPSRSKDAKVLSKRRKQAFFSELGKTSIKGNPPSGDVNEEAPSWAPLCDNYMLTNPKLKDWDKVPDSTVADDIGKMSEDSGSDDD